MKVRSDFLTQMSRYAKGDMDLNSFRKWHLAEMLQVQTLSREDEGLLLLLQTYFSDLHAGAPESSLKDSVSSLIGLLSVPETQRYTFVFPSNLEVSTTSETTASSGSRNTVELVA